MGVQKLDGERIKKFLIRNNTYLILLLLVVFSSVLTDEFLSVMNIRNIFLQQAGPICMAIGMLFVILTGGIDLAVGSYMAFGVSMMGLLFVNNHLPMGISIVITLVLGMVLGVITGIFVAYTNMQGFIASLAMMTVARGISFVLTNGIPIPIPIGTLDKLVAKSAGYPVFFILIGIIALFLFIQIFTTYGRLVIACGSNRNAVELAGIRVRRYIASVYSISALLSVFAGLVAAARVSTASPSLGAGLELNAIAACAIGGASLSGGVGSVLKTVAGVLVLALIGNVMNLMSVPPYPQDIIKGVIIVLAVLLQWATGRTGRPV
ncbi:MAG: ABC transporter permease [Spirochaetaceae bacterium]|jgi:ribose transport system permease protein|nr:ABC transporter permease [Spirochaetaceae bacterium]